MEIGKTVDGADVVVAVERGDDQVSRLGGMDRHLSGVFVTDLTQTDDIGVLAQGVAQQL